jgi:tetratricopeptide (TPR) repeat protein
VVRIDPTNPWARNYYGFSLGKGGRVDEAVRVLEEGTRLFPRNEFTHFLLGLAYYEKGHVIKALGELAKAPGAVRYFR